MRCRSGGCILVADRCAFVRLQIPTNRCLGLLQVGWTALMYAAENGHVAIVSELLSRGANTEHANPVSK